MSDWYKHREAWRASYHDRSGRLRYLRAVAIEPGSWEVRTFDGSLDCIGIDEVQVQQRGTKALPPEVKTWMNRRATKPRR